MDHRKVTLYLLTKALCEGGGTAQSQACEWPLVKGGVAPLFVIPHRWSSVSQTSASRRIPGAVALQKDPTPTPEQLFYLRVPSARKLGNTPRSGEGIQHVVKSHSSQEV